MCKQPFLTPSPPNVVRVSSGSADPVTLKLHHPSRDAVREVGDRGALYEGSFYDPHYLHLFSVRPRVCGLITTVFVSLVPQHTLSGMARLGFTTLLAFIAVASAQRRCGSELSQESVLQALADFEHRHGAQRSAELHGRAPATCRHIIPVRSSIRHLFLPTIDLTHAVLGLLQRHHGWRMWAWCRRLYF
jgi:hypothetical protein